MKSKTLFFRLSRKKKRQTLKIYRVRPCPTHQPPPPHTTAGRTNATLHPRGRVHGGARRCSSVYAAEHGRPARRGIARRPTVEASQGDPRSPSPRTSTVFYPPTPQSPPSPHRPPRALSSRRRARYRGNGYTLLRPSSVADRRLPRWYTEVVGGEDAPPPLRGGGGVLGGSRANGYIISIGRTLAARPTAAAYNVQRYNSRAHTCGAYTSRAGSPEDDAKRPLRKPSA